MFSRFFSEEGQGPEVPTLPPDPPPDPLGL